MSHNTLGSGERKYDVPECEVTEFHAKSCSYALVIPVIDEGDRLIRQLSELATARYPVDIIVADGGSRDGSTSPSLLSQMGVGVLITTSDAGGLSAQLRAAYHYCMEVGYSGVITMDGNGKDCISGVPRIIDALNRGFDYVQGSRFRPGGRAINTPWMRLLAIRLIHSPLTSIAAQSFITDSTNGFRGYSADLLSDSRVSIFRDVFRSYELIAYLPIRAGRLRFEITEVPVVRTYPSQGPVPTKIHGTRAHARMLNILMRAVFGQYDPVASAQPSK